VYAAADAGSSIPIVIVGIAARHVP